MKLIRFAALGVFLVLAACSKTATPDKPADAAATPPKPPVVTVNGKAISPEMFEADPGIRAALEKSGSGVSLEEQLRAHERAMAQWERAVRLAKEQVEDALDGEILVELDQIECVFRESLVHHGFHDGVHLDRQFPDLAAIERRFDLV